MSPYLIGALFGGAFIAALVTLVTSVDAQAPRFSDLFRRERRA